MVVVVIDALDEGGLELTPVDDQHPVKALAANRANETHRRADYSVSF
jgi:hypothetical protein